MAIAEAQFMSTSGLAGDLARTAPPKIALELDVTDPEVVAELRRHEGDEQIRYALEALRIGVLSLRLASGHVDAAAIREAGQKLVGDMGQVLADRASTLDTQLTTALKQYFDPSTGLVPQRIEALVRKDGELDQVLRAHFGPDDSVLAKTLAANLGSGSQIFRMLSPTDAEGLKAQVARALDVALKTQTSDVVGQFSLDNKEGALVRLLDELRLSQGNLQTDLRGQVESVVKEFSLDQPGSALNRLVDKVEAAQRSIAEQFSMDNDGSALKRLSGLLENTSQTIGKHLTLDDEQSALSRLKRELTTTIEDMVKRNTDFHSAVQATLAGIQARKEEAEKGTRHGTTFEEQLGSVLENEAQRLQDVFKSVGSIVGDIKNCKKGDHVTELGSDSAAAGAVIAWEAKEDKSYDLARALDEIDEARKNRRAQVGVFVFSKKTAPPGLEPFFRKKNDLVVVWDADDPSTDLFVRAAYSVARALVVRLREQTGHARDSVEAIERATRDIEKQIKFLEDVETWSKTIENNGKTIEDRAAAMRGALAKQVETLDLQLGVLKMSAEQSAA